MNNASRFTILFRFMLGQCAVILALLVLVVVGYVKLVHTSDDVQNNQRSTCTVQSRGLPASHHLSKAMGDLSTILNDLNDNGLIPVLSSSGDKTLTDLEAQTAAYSSIESRQPNSRNC
jgi:hypothetical protein